MSPLRIFLSLFLCISLPACAPEPLRSGSEINSWIEQKRNIACELPQGYRLSDGFLLERHVFVSDSEGYVVPRDPANKNDFSDAFRTVMGGFAKAVEDARAQNKPAPRLLFYFNGGLNSQELVERQAARQVPCMIADGYYPVFFVWDTDGFKSYGEQVTSVWDGQISKYWLTRARTPLVVLGHVLSGLGQAPDDYAIHGRRFWRALRREPACSLLLKPEASRNCPVEQQVMYVDPTGKIDADRNVVVADKPEESELEVPEFLYYTLLTPVRWVTTPFAHGLGEAAWANFLRRTRTTIRRSIEFNLDRHADPDGDGVIDGPSKCRESFKEEIKYFPRGSGAFAKFFEIVLQYRLQYRYGVGMPRLQWRCEKDRETAEPSPKPEELDKQREQDKAIAAAIVQAKITLIGHSMGAIVINELLERFPDLPYSDIVVMASAASLRDTRRVLDRYFEDPELSKDTRFFSLMLHPLNDARERQYVGSIPSGSLLMWVDEMYDVPKTPEDKVFGFWPTAKPARRMFGRATQERMLYRVFSRPHAVPEKGEPSNPIEHGHFNEDDMCFWRPSFWGVKQATSLEGRYKDLPEQALRLCGEKHTEPQRQ